MRHRNTADLRGRLVRELVRLTFRLALLAVLFSAAGGIDITTHWVKR